MKPFEVDVQPTTDESDLAMIAIRAGETALTRLLRDGEAASDYLIAPPVQLAFWLIDNWWRLRWECIPPEGANPAWRLAHDLTGAGGGYAWPRILIWGEDDRVRLFSRADPVGVVGPVRYLTSALVSVEADAFEEEIDRFLQTAEHALGAGSSERLALGQALAALSNERDDPETADWRRLEARLGFDPDTVPDEIMRELAALGERYGAANIEEAAMAAPGEGAVTVLNEQIESALQSSVVCALDIPFRSDEMATDGAARVRPAPMTAWERAEADADQVRNSYGIGPGPLRNKGLGEVLGVAQSAFGSTGGATVPSSQYGLRVRDGQRHRVTLTSRRSHARRFDLARALGDAIWSDAAALGPIAASRTNRQQYQRAFAQALLCPFEALRSYIRADTPADSDIEAAAKYFHVSERVVRTILVNKGVLPRRLITGSGQDIPMTIELDEFANAA